MTWSYSGDPADSTLDEVRFLIGDTDTTDQLLSDEEINYTIAKFPNVYAAAAECCRAIAAKLEREMAETSVSESRLKITLRDRAAGYRKQADLYTARLSTNAVPYAGGISVSDKQTRENDTDRVNPVFARGMHDFGNADDDERLDD